MGLTRKPADAPGYANNRFTSARDMALEITRRYGKTPAAVHFHNWFGSEKAQPWT